MTKKTSTDQIYYYHDNRYRVKLLDRVAHCYDCDATPTICHALGKPCMQINPTHCVLRLVR